MNRTQSSRNGYGYLGRNKWTDPEPDVLDDGRGQTIVEEENEDQSYTTAVDRSETSPKPMENKPIRYTRKVTHSSPALQNCLFMEFVTLMRQIHKI